MGHEVYCFHYSDTYYGPTLYKTNYKENVFYQIVVSRKRFKQISINISIKYIEALNINIQKKSCGISASLSLQARSSSCIRRIGSR